MSHTTTDNWIQDEDAVSAFLQFGYVPGQPNLEPYLRGVDPADTSHLDEDALVERGERALADSFRRAIDGYRDWTHVVPLSGGLDTRTILAELLDLVGPERIRTVTFGMPGTWDYDIPKRISRRFGLNSTFVDLRPAEFPWSDELVFEHCDVSTPVPVIECTVNRYAQQCCTDDRTVYWPGFNVEPGAIAMSAPETWDAAVDEFVAENALCESLARDGFDARSFVPDGPLVDQARLPFDQQLDYALRQEYYSRPLVIPGDDCPVALPLLRRPWRQFCLSLDLASRRDRRLFKKIVRTRHPTLMDVPMDSTYGTTVGTPRPIQWGKALAYKVADALSDRIGASFVHPASNYYDFDAIFVHDALEAWVGRNLQDLAARPVANWVSPTDVWRRYRTGAALGTEIRLLLSLELYCKMKENQRVPPVSS